MMEANILSPGETFSWKEIQFIVLKVPVGTSACSKCDLWQNGFCLADDSIPFCKRLGIAFKNSDNKKFKKFLKQL
jgi:hypothetical protein